MHFTSAEISAFVGTFIWPFVRIAAVVGSAPIFGAQLVPVRIKLAIALALTFVIMPMVPEVPAVDALSPSGILIIVHQVLIGLFMGFMLQMVFGAFVMAGQVLAMSMGLGFASMNDPATGVTIPTVGQFFTIAVTLTFVAFNGHLILIEVLADSFRTIPIAPEGISLAALWGLVGWASHMFAGAVMIALPAISAMLVVNLGFAVMTRAAPQLNIFAIGFSIIITLGFTITMLALPVMLSHLPELSDSAFSIIKAIGQGSN